MIHLLTKSGEEVQAEDYEPMETSGWYEDDGVLYNESEVEWPVAESRWGEIAGAHVVTDEIDRTVKFDTPHYIGEDYRAIIAEGNLALPAVAEQMKLDELIDQLEAIRDVEGNIPVVDADSGQGIVPEVTDGVHQEQFGVHRRRVEL